MTVDSYKDYVILLSTQVAGEPTANPILDAEMAVKVLLPSVVREVIRRRISNGGQIQNLIRRHDLTGVGTIGTELIEGGNDGFALPSSVREEFVDFMTVGTDESDLGLFSYVPHRFDFLRQANYILPRFTVQNRTLYASKTDADLTSLILFALTEPELIDEIDIDEAMLDDAIALTASIIKGELPLTSLGVTLEVATGQTK